MVPNSPAQAWQRTLFDLLARPEIGAPLKEAALAGALGDWTRHLTAAVVAACEAAGWRAAAKGFRGGVLPVARNEYLVLDVVAFSESSARWPLPVAVFELENSPADDPVGYSLWKVLCVRAAARFVFAYRRDVEDGIALVDRLAQSVIGGWSIADRFAIGGETMLIVGNRGGAETFPYRYFRAWTLDTNTGRFFERSLTARVSPMAKLKPWYDAVKPREDLREGKPLDASEFAVNLEDIRAGRAPKDYQEPQRFFERTFLTRNLKDLAAQAVRRLSGITVETSPVFNMATQFGGGKTHALALLYHLAEAGPKSHDWPGVRGILDQAGVKSVPRAATAVFVGQKFDSIHGRGGANGEPRRRTPWGEIAWQLGGARSFAVVAEHDEKGVAPGGDAIQALLPDGPALILMDELMNYVSRERGLKSKLGDQLFNFVQNLSEEARGRTDVVLCVSIPASELEMTPEDQADYERFKKMLDRLGKAVIMSAETETAEIIRRRLFEWSGLPEEAKATASAFANWVIEHRQMVGDFDADSARERFLASYPLHPALLSVFERKWQSVHRFQKTRGVLRLLALWVSQAYIRGYKGRSPRPPDRAGDRAGG